MSGSSFKLNVLQTYKWLSLASLYLVIGCGKETPTYSLLPDQNIFQQSASTLTNKIDIVWVIDNSGSMQDDQINVANNFNTFISSFVNKQYDFKISVVGTDAYRGEFNSNLNYLAKFRDGDGVTNSGVFVVVPGTANLINTFKTNVKLGTAGSGDERAFQSMKAALDYPSAPNTGFLRSNAFLSVIILSDEDDFSHSQSDAIAWDYTDPRLHTIDSYVSYLDQKTGSTPLMRKYSVSAIAIFDDACKALNQFGTKGIRYGQLVDATAGVKGDLCATNFASVLDQIQNNIAELSTQFYLNRVPRPETLSVIVDGAPVPMNSTNGFSYLAGNNSIRFHGQYIPRQNATIVVNFDPVTIKQ